RPLELDAHIYAHTLVGTDRDSSLQRLIGELISQPLAHDRPLWRLHLIDGDSHGHGAAILARVHHSLGDGLAMLLVLLSLTDLSAAPDAANPLHELFARPDDAHVLA